MSLKIDAGRWGGVDFIAFTDCSFFLFWKKAVKQQSY